MKAKIAVTITAVLFLLPFFCGAQTDWKLAGNNLAGGEKLGSKNAFPVSIFTNNVQRMTITSGGNVGIGTTTPNAQFQLGSTTANRKIVLYDDLNNDNQFYGLGINDNVLRYQVGGTTSDHVFYTGASSTTSNELMRIKGTGNVGIGTTAPTAKLHVAGSQNVDGTLFVRNPTTPSNYGRLLHSGNLHLDTYGAGALYLNFFSGTNTYIGNGSSGYVATFLSNGNVGIGIAGPHAQLHLANSAVNKKIVLWEDANNDHQFYGFGINGSALRYQVSGTTTDHVFYAATSSTTSNELMRIKGNGNVGIGLTSPNWKLDVNGSIHAVDYGPPGSKNLVIGDDAFFTDVDQANVIGLYGNADPSVASLQLGSAGGTITGHSGNIGIGGIIPTFSKLQVFANTTQSPTLWIHNLFNSTSANEGVYIQAGNDGGTGNSFFAAFLTPGGNYLGSITQNGPFSVLYTTSSDQRLKANIRNTTVGLEDVKKIEVKDYRFINDNNEQTGFIAQQLFEVFPDAVSVGGENAKEKPWMVDYGRITPLLVKAIQDLDAINTEKQKSINTLQSTVADQQRQIDELKSKMNEIISSLSFMNEGAGKIRIETDNPSIFLGQNIPNPFDNSTIIPFRIPKNCYDASIVISEVATGKIITAIPVSCHETNVMIDAGILASGSYSYTLYVDGRVIDSKQMVLTK
jgi:uncharacterized coiled-coil protein SlyX